MHVVKCTHDGCKETKTETIPATGHDYETKTVVVKEAYDEQVPYDVWVCNGCGEEFESADALKEHIYGVMDGTIPDHPTNDSVITKYKTVHHDAETREEHVCKVCGHVKED